MIKSSYDLQGIWVKGNLHSHTKNSPCGFYDIEKVIKMYTSFDTNYDFLAITDHYILTELKDYINDDKIILFQGVEYKARDFQTLGININKYDDDKEDINNHQELFNSVVNQDGINIICHPHTGHDDYWPFNKLIELDNYIGIEIFNNNVKFESKGRAVATDLWDELLTSGKVVYGFANDDMHVFSRVGGAFNMVLVKERSREAIIESIKNGRFYSSTGVTLKSIRTKGNLITVTAENLPVEFKFIGKNGYVYHTGVGVTESYNCKGDEGYIRVELIREDGAKAWTQPFYLE